jgi:hypothetical protein
MLLRPRNQGRGTQSPSSSVGDEAEQAGPFATPAEQQPLRQRRAAGWAAGGMLSLLFLLLLLLALGATRGGNPLPLFSAEVAAGGRLAVSGGGILSNSNLGPALSSAVAQHPDIAEACSAEFRNSNSEAVQQGEPPLVVQVGGPVSPSVHRWLPSVCCAPRL